MRLLERLSSSSLVSKPMAALTSSAAPSSDRVKYRARRRHFKPPAFLFSDRCIDASEYLPPKIVRYCICHDGEPLWQVSPEFDLAGMTLNGSETPTKPRAPRLSAIHNCISASCVAIPLQ